VGSELDLPLHGSLAFPHAIPRGDEALAPAERADVRGSCITGTERPTGGFVRSSPNATYSLSYTPRA
jgi:hypothetical protein